jgi:hypothetical protein
MSLKEYTVSMVGQDGRTYETTVEATGLFDAAVRALEQWSRRGGIDRRELWKCGWATNAGG